MGVLQSVERFLYDSSRFKVVSVLWMLLILKVGVWSIPNAESIRSIAQDPFTNPFLDLPHAHYLLWTWLSPFLAWLIGATGVAAFFLWHLALTLASTALFGVLAFSRLSESQARTALVLFAALPVSGSVYYWVGPDALTLLLMLGALVVRRAAVALFLGLLLGLQHFEQSFLGMTALLVLVLTQKRRGVDPVYPVATALSVLLGTVLGKVCLGLLFMGFRPRVNSGRWHWMQEHLDPLLSNVASHPHGVLWGILGVSWLVVIWVWRAGGEHRWSLLPLGLLLPWVLVTADHTRVFGLLTFFSVGAAWLLHPGFLEHLPRPKVALLAVLTVVVPWTWAWEGETHWTVLPSDLVMLEEVITGEDRVAEDYGPWPWR